MFTDRKIYLSASVQGIIGCDANLLWEVCQWMISSGADVLSEHVAGRTADEVREIFQHRSGIDRDAAPNPPLVARQVDFGWVDECSHLIAIVDGPSLGVGMELQRALDRSDKPPVLALIHVDNWSRLSWMVKGLCAESGYPQFSLVTYTDAASMKQAITEFLLR